MKEKRQEELITYGLLWTAFNTVLILILVLFVLYLENNLQLVIEALP